MIMFIQKLGRFIAFKFRELRLRELQFFGNQQKVFEFIWKSNYWGHDETRSGEGSSLEYTSGLRATLPSLFNRYRVESLLDAPCGDFNWMKEVVIPSGIKYIGADIVENMVSNLNTQYASGNVEFIVIDITSDKLPYADLMMCRDVLLHLTYQDTLRFLENFLDSQIPLLLTSTHDKSSNFKNKDIKVGHSRFVDLFSAPYSFPAPPLELIDDWIEPYPVRQLGLWTRSQVEDAVIKMTANLAGTS
jgi:hypothetical protein